MASGDLIGIPLAIATPETLFANKAARLGGSTPVEAFPIWSFDDSADEYLDILLLLWGYSAATGVTVNIKWMSEDQTSGTVRWGAAFRRLQDDNEDLDVSHTYVYNTVDPDLDP